MERYLDNILIYHGDKQNDYLSLLSSNKGLVLKDIELSKDRLIGMEQTAQDIISVVDFTDAGAGYIEGLPKIGQADAMICSVENVFLTVRTADCFPILICDKLKKVVAAVHSGREGTRLNIVGKTIDKMKKEYNINVENLYVYIGAGVCKRHYVVDQECYMDFYNSLSALFNKEDLAMKLNCHDYHIDLLEAIKLQLHDCSISNAQIKIENECTYENDRYFSYRRDKTKNRQISVIGIVK